MQKPQVTEIKVRMDCNGCVQKIKKALQGITGICDVDVDFSEQKIRITGRAEPEKLVKAIRRTRKSAVICIDTEQPQPTEPPPHGQAAAEEGGAQTPPEQSNPPPEEAAAAAEAPDEKNPPPATSQPHQPPRQKDDGVHIIYHHPPDHEYDYPQWNAYHGGPGFRGELYQQPQAGYVQSYNAYRTSPHATEYAYSQSPPRYSFNSRPDLYGPGFRGEPPQPVHATHRYNTYEPSPYVTGYVHPQSPPKDSLRGEPSQPCQPLYATHNYNMYKPSPYVTEYAYPRSPPRHSSYSIPDNYSRDYNSGNYENGNVTSMFSDENPNACKIV